MTYDTLAAHEAARLGVNRTVLVDAIKAGSCAGEQRGGYWYTSETAAAAWYREHYRYSGELYSQTAGKRWSARDVARLTAMLQEGRSLEDIAHQLKRSMASVKTKASKLRADGAAPTAAAVKATRRQQAAVQEARALLDQEQTGESKTDEDWYQQRRRLDKEGRVRLHLHPAVKARLGRAARAAGLTLAQYVTRAGLAAIDDPDILERGARIAADMREDVETYAARDRKPGPKTGGQ